MKNSKTRQDVKIGIIGGSGVYQMEGISGVEEFEIKTPFGSPSDKIIVGTISGRKVAFLPRHGRGHVHTPTEVNSRANIYAMKYLGVERLISVSACGSLKEEIMPKDFVLPDQIFDRTRLRVPTFFGKGVVGHVSFAEPFCTELRRLVFNSAEGPGTKTHFGGTYVCIEGPQFSTKAESEVNRKLGFSIVGMTALPEAKLAREAEMCYATIALVTDYDVWKEGEEVTAEKVVENLNANVDNVKKLLKKVIPLIDISNKRDCPCSTAVKYAVFTQKDKLNKTTLKKLDLLIGKYVK